MDLTREIQTRHLSSLTFFRDPFHLLRPGGQIMILNLLRHAFEQAHDLYGDRWPGFTESELQGWPEEVGFKKVEVTVVAREEEEPHFQTVLAT